MYHSVLHQSCIALSTIAPRRFIHAVLHGVCTHQPHRTRQARHARQSRRTSAPVKCPGQCGSNFKHTWIVRLRNSDLRCDSMALCVVGQSTPTVGRAAARTLPRTYCTYGMKGSGCGTGSEGLAGGSFETAIPSLRTYTCVWVQVAIYTVSSVPSCVGILAQVSHVVFFSLHRLV